MFGNLLGSRGNPLGEEETWHVGGRYGLRPGCELHLRVGPTPEAASFPAHTQSVLLLQINSTRNAWTSSDTGDPEEELVGLVVPGPSAPTGWVTLESPMGPGPLIRRRLGGSWEVRARYFVQHLSTLRIGAELSSDRICHLEPGEEVLSLQLRGSRADTGARLRMMVSTETKLIGWLSPETANGDRLLYPVNLLSPAVVELCKPGKRRWRSWALSAPVPRYFSFSLGRAMPWTVGGQYRVLERVALLQGSEPGSSEACKLAPGTLVTIEELHIVRCPCLSWRPVAFVLVDEGRHRCRRGWLRCAGNDGRDLIDTRNQQEVDEILEKLGRQGACAVTSGHPLQNVEVAARTAEFARVAAGTPGYSYGWPVFDDNGQLLQAESVLSSPISSTDSNFARLVRPEPASAHAPPDIDLPEPASAHAPLDIELPAEAVPGTLPPSIVLRAGASGDPCEGTIIATGRNLIHL
uniref:Uncharacterized protein n=1 Tax=Alexandrium monilatum TaxID=311494 RepID=A0A7S4SGK9_9DINO